MAGKGAQSSCFPSKKLELAEHSFRSWTAIAVHPNSETSLGKRPSSVILFPGIPLGVLLYQNLVKTRVLVYCRYTFVRMRPQTCSKQKNNSYLLLFGALHVPGTLSLHHVN